LHVLKAVIRNYDIETGIAERKTGGIRLNKTAQQVASIRALSIKPYYECRLTASRRKTSFVRPKIKHARARK
jgi:hypothetical protein